MISVQNKLLRRVSLFIATGGLAALLHLTIVFLLVSYFNQLPLVANVFAFLTAFNVSYLGHRHFTFAGMEDERQLQLPHFFAVAVSAGCLNELLYYLVLNYTSLPYLPALVLVLGLVAVYSYTLSQWWACR